MKYCSALKCENNDNGYCSIESYITISEDGRCEDFNETKTGGVVHES